MARRRKEKRKTKNVKRKSVRVKSSRAGGRSSSEFATMTPPSAPILSNLASKIPPLPRWGVGAFVVGGLLLAIGLWQKEWIVAASVNGKPLTGLELFKRMSRDYRAVALDNLINEKLIFQDAQKRNAIPSDLEVEAKVGELEAQYGGKETFEMLFKQQGQTRDSVQGQVKLQLAMEKMFGNEVAVSAEEVDKYVLENKEFLQATDSAGQKLEAEKTLRDQKLRGIFGTKFNELKNSASIKIY